MKYLFVLFVLSAAINSNAQTPHLLKDIYPGTSSGYPNSGTTLALVNNKLFITGVDPIHGVEPWISDGTTSGTYLLKDMVPGNGPSIGARQPFYYNGNYYFMGADANVNGELFTTDLTEAGTSFVTDLYPGPVGSSPYLVGEVNGIAVIGAYDQFVNNTSVHHLYSTDGTAGNTDLLRADVYYGHERITMNNKIYFTASTNMFPSNDELWVTDGTTAGTQLLKEIDPGPDGSDPKNFVRLNNTQFLFSATDPVHGRELWISDGTTAGTHILKDMVPGINSGSPYSFYKWNNKVYFGATSSSSGLWVTDGTDTGTRKLNVPSLSQPSSLVEVNGKLLFKADDGVHGYELWVTDGVDSNTKMLMDINLTGNSELYINDRAVVGNTLYFTANDGTHGREIWITDGDTATLFYDLNPGSATGFAFQSPLLILNNKIYFAGNDGTAGTEVYYFDVSNTSVKEMNNQLAAAVYPNPTNGTINIVADMEKATITVSNLLGQVVDTRNNISGERYIIDISEQPAGVYIIEVYSKGSQSRHKVVKK